MIIVSQFLDFKDQGKPVWIFLPYFFNLSHPILVILELSLDQSGSFRSKSLIPLFSIHMPPSPDPFTGVFGQIQIPIY